ncbi:MAG: hypothetical protein V4819_16495 [Verrucomicrobiota bacterium]
MKKTVGVLLSHALALAVGWVAFRGGERADGVAKTEAAHRVTKTQRTDDAEQGRRVLAEMRQAWGTGAAAAATVQSRTQRPSAESMIRKMREDSRRQEDEELGAIRQQMQTVVLPADPAAELTRLIAGPEIKNTAAFAIAWLCADPAAALQFLEGSEVLMRNSNMTRALKIWVAEAGADKVIGLLEQAPGWRAKLAGALVNVAAAENPAQLDGLLEQLEGTLSREQLIEQAFRNLPEEKRPAALEWILTSLKGKEAGRAVMKTALGMEDKVAAKAFLKQAAPRLDPEGMQELKGWGNYGDIMRSGVGPESPIEERVEAMLAGGVVGKTDEERRSNARSSIVSQDVSSWMAREQLGEVLKSGGMGAAELWQEVGKNFPQYATAEQKALLGAVFSASAASDPEGAVKLLELQGQADQAATYVLRAADSMIHNDTERALKLVNQLPPETIRQNLAAFDRFYTNTVNGLATERASFWTEWVRQQPAGINKDLMLHYTARHYFQKGNEALGTELKDMVQDPTVKSWPKL